METLFATRIQNTPRSFIREILKVTQDPSIISFAGGLPNAKALPVTELAEAAKRVLSENGSQALQYGTSQGFAPLREVIAKRYHQQLDLEVDADNILITHGSQQGLFLLGEIFLNSNDAVVIERPGYLGAIQALSMTESQLEAVDIDDRGMDPTGLEEILLRRQIRMLYTIPNFQNPSGIQYSQANRQAIANLLASRYTVLVEDDPYGELHFIDDQLPSFWDLLPEQSVLLGSFSKIVAPGLRLGWVCAPRPIIEKLLVAKQAADLHTSTLTQRILYAYLCHNDIENHIQHLRGVYARQCAAMLAALEQHVTLPVTYTRPGGGMFLWLTLPEGLSAKRLLVLALEKKVAVVPGTPFYLDGAGDRHLRLNFSNSEPDEINEGIRRLAEAMEEMDIE